MEAGDYQTTEEYNAGVKPTPEVNAFDAFGNLVQSGQDVTDENNVTTWQPKVDTDENPVFVTVTQTQTATTIWEILSQDKLTIELFWGTSIPT